MAVVPDKVLTWLYTVLTGEYHDANRTYNDTAEALSNYPSLSPRTEVYTFENGSSALLLLISGTIPVQFRGATYRFPIAIWIPHAYPRESPIAYVTPSQDMLIRPGQHVGGDGRIYHPYLAQWALYWDKSSISDFLTVLRGVFTKEPPVISKQQAQAASRAPAPPPVPPPPEEYRRSLQSHPTPPSRSEDGYSVPPVPPKPGADGRVSASSVHPHTVPNDNVPPLPRHPSQVQDFRLQSSQQVAYGVPPQFTESPQQRASSFSPGRPHVAPLELSQHQRIRSLQYQLESPVSPIIQDSVPQRHLQQPYFPPQPTYSHQQPNNVQSYQYPPPPSQMYPPQPAHPAGVQRHAPPPVDLLSSPLDVTIPSQSGSLSPIPAPPIPPNPEKDALLHAISQTLVAQIRRTLESNKGAIPPLEAQQSALGAAHGVLQRELEQLQHLDATLETNERVLRSAMSEADQVMRDAAGRRRPQVDEVLVCPTVVGSQLYALVADEKACGDSRVALGRGLDNGRLSLDVFVKQTRSIAREEFLKKALIQKIAHGMGLDERQW